MRAAYAPRTKLTVSQWADRYGWIARSSGAAESGQYSTARNPYMREILDVMGDEVHRDVVFNKPAQVGFTEALNQFVGYCIAEDPSTIIVVQPNVEMAKAWMKERIDPMLAESPRLRGTIRAEGGRRSSDDTMQRKVYAGGALVAIGANAPAQMRSRPSRRVIGDERSGWTLDAKQQGDPWGLLGERTATFWNAKRIQGSTPGEAETCPITAALAESDLRRYHVVCPECGFREPFMWKSPGPDGKPVYRLRFDREQGDTGPIIPATARYLCVGCGVLLPEREKPRMMRPENGAGWVATHPGREVAGFDLNGLVSPWRTWEDIGHLWRDAQGNHEKLKVFVTHVLAEPWQPEGGDRIDVHALLKRATEPAKAPETAAGVTAFVDVQADRLESLIVAWSGGEAAHVLRWERHEGDPTRPQVYADCWQHLLSDHGAPLLAVGIDTGYLTSDVWKYTDPWMRQGRVKIFRTKGMPGRGRPVLQKPGAAKTKSERRPWLVGVDTVKDMIALRLRNVEGAGAFQFAEDLDAAYFDQLTSEELKLVTLQGRPQKVWRLIPNRRNEGLDLTVGCLAVLHGLGARILAQLAAMATQRSAPEAQPSAPAPQEPAGVVVPPAAMRPPPRRGGGWVNGWRK